MPKKKQNYDEAQANSAVRDYIFITRRGEDDKVLGFGVGHDAKDAYKDMIKNNPTSKGFPASGWHLNCGAEGIPVGPKPVGQKEK